MRLTLAALAVLALACPAHAEPVPVDMAAPVVHNDLLVASAPAPVALPVAPPALPPASGAVALVVLALGLLGAALRRFTPSVHFFQSTNGMLVASLLSALIAAATQAITEHGFSLYAIAAACISAATTALAMANPSTAAKAAVLAVLVSTTACAASPYDKARQSLTGIEAAVASTAKLVDAYDRPHQEDVRSSAAATCQQGDVACIELAEKAALAHYRSNRNTAVKALVSLGAAASLAEAGVTVAESAKSQGFDPLAAVAQLGPALQEAVEALKAIGIQSAALAAIVGGL